MRFLPVVERELRVTSRTPRLYWSRFAAALIALAVVSWIWFTLGPGQTSAVRARQMFWTLAGFALFYTLLQGIFITADSISEEKRHGTLGLLFLTNLRGYDVILGKMFANSLYAFYGLLAMLPVLAIPLLLGGLTAGDYWRVALILVESLFFSLSIGMFVSTLSKIDRKAQTGTFVTIILFALVLPGIALWIKEEFRWDPITALYTVSPIYTFGLASDSQHRLYSTEFWTSCIVIGAIAIAALLAAALLVPRIWQDRPRVGAAFRRQQKIDRLTLGNKEARQRGRKEKLDVNPFFWLAARNRMKPLYVWEFLGVCALIWLYLFFRHGDNMLEDDAFFLCALILHTTLKIWLAAESGQRFAEDRRSGALELTLSTPISVREILEGQFMALFRQFGGPIGVILMFDVAGLIIGSYSSLGRADGAWVLFCIVGIIVMIVDCFAIVTLGMWLGLSTRKANLVMSKVVFRILILPWIVLFLLLMFVSVSGTHIDSMNFFTGAYFLTSLVIDFVFFTSASNNLNTRFREIATQRFDAR